LGLIYLSMRLRRGCHLSRASVLGVLAAAAMGFAECARAPQDGSPLPPNSRADSRHEIGRAGALSVLAGNPRYFSDASGRRAVYLTGSHTWNNFQDWGPGDPPRPFDYAAYLDLLARHGHNFIRLYVWEQAAWFPGTEEKIVIAPLSYLRTGPGVALDGSPRFDLTRFNPAYFRRLRERVEAAAARGFYVSVMLFDGWSIELKGERVGNPWRGHPFNRENNINRIDGDTNGDGEGKETHTLANPPVVALQKIYLKKVVETLSDLDNVLWEVSNESHSGSAAWQYEMIRTIRTLDARQGARHPIGMTSMYPEPPEKNATLFQSPADWISPHDGSEEPYGEDPPASSGRKVILTDTDHIWGVGGSPSWVWKSFFRGLNPLFMDPYVTAIRHNLPTWPSSNSAATLSDISSPAPEWEEIRRALGQARALADRVELASMRPMGELASTGYCLAAPGREYLVFVPFQEGRLKTLVGRGWSDLVAEHVEIDLSAARGTFVVEWVDAGRGLIVHGDSVIGGRRLEFRAPLTGDAVLRLQVQEATTAGRLPAASPGDDRNQAKR